MAFTNRSTPVALPAVIVTKTLWLRAYSRRSRTTAPSATGLPVSLMSLSEVNRLLEGWYRPMVSAFYRLSRLPVVDGIPAEVTQLGQMFGDARTHWPPSSPLSLLVQRLIAIVRNSEAHNNTTLDLDTERFIFINKNPAGVERHRWSASSAEFERLAIHVDHLGELMQTFLLTVPFRSLGPDLLFALLTDLFSSAERAPGQPTDTGHAQ